MYGNLSEPHGIIKLLAVSFQAVGIQQHSRMSIFAADETLDLIGLDKLSYSCRTNSKYLLRLLCSDEAENFIPFNAKVGSVQ